MKNANYSRPRDLYIKWLKEDEGNQKWNSTFSHDPTFLASIEHLKPDARSDSDRVMTQYSVEQNRDSKMNMYNYIDQKIIMKKVPNYQYGIDMVSVLFTQWIHLQLSTYFFSLGISLEISRFHFSKFSFFSLYGTNL